MKFFFRKDKTARPPTAAVHARQAGQDMEVGYEAALPFLSAELPELMPEIHAANDPVQHELPPRLAAGC